MELVESTVQSEVQVYRANGEVMVTPNLTGQYFRSLVRAARAVVALQRVAATNLPGDEDGKPARGNA